MAGRRTNLALAGVVALALVTGAGAFAAGGGSGRWVVAAHGAAGLAIVLLAPWKSVVVRRGLRRRHPRPGRAGALALTLAAVLALGFGIAHSTGLARTFGPVTASLSCQEISRSTGPSWKSPRRTRAPASVATTSPLRRAAFSDMRSSQPSQGFSGVPSRSMRRSSAPAPPAAAVIRSRRRPASALSLSVVRAPRRLTLHSLRRRMEASRRARSRCASSYCSYACSRRRRRSSR